jgi:hypothetical protein
MTDPTLSERTPHREKAATFKQQPSDRKYNNIWSQVPEWARHLNILHNLYSWRMSLHPLPEDMPCCSDRDPPNDEDSFYEELEHVFDKLHKYRMKNLLGEINANVGREDIFKPTIGNESLRKISMIIELD